jgi:hypothetical protein
MSARDRVLRALLRIYKLTLSPALMAVGVRCRHTPSCSEYCVEAVCRHGWGRGLILGAGRVLRCRPGGTWGDDPVPPVKREHEGGAASHA